MTHMSSTPLGHWRSDAANRHPTAPPLPGGQSAGLVGIERAVVETVAYADVFDFPLTGAEIHRYLVAQAATRPMVDVALTASGVRSYLSHHNGLVTLRGRESNIPNRRRRRAIAEQQWPQARRYGKLIAGLPFVRLVAVSGTLAVDNVDADADIDYFVVTEPGRLWLCRAFVIALVRWAARRQVTICPNYFLSERALALDDRSQFVAHEITQMVPLAGQATYARFRHANAWTARYLPNANGPPRPVEFADGQSTWGRAVERLARSSVAGSLERWEMARKVRRFDRRAAGDREASFGPERCKGHFGSYGARVSSAWAVRLRAMGLAS